MRNFFSGGLKDNSHLAFGFLTGILRVAKESIFSGMNNLKTNSILDESYSEYFGFTKEEVQDMLCYYGKEEKYQEISDMVLIDVFLSFSQPGKISGSITKITV